MNVDLFRKLDRYLGIPACFIATILNKLRFKSKDSKPIKKILFLQISELGSSILARPAIQYLKQKYPGAELFYLIFEEQKFAIEMLDLIPKENIKTIRASSMSTLIGDTIHVAGQLKKMKFDVIIDLELFARFSACLSFLINPRINIGFNKFHMEGLYLGSFHTHKVMYNHAQHISRNFMAMAKAIESSDIPLFKENLKKEIYPDFFIQSTQEEKNWMFQKLKSINEDITQEHKIVIINPNASALLPIRKWPLQNYCQLAKKLLQDKDVFLVITGTAAEKPDAIAISNYVNQERCIDLTGKTTMRELIDLYNISDALVSNDSGPPHFASLTQIHIFVFFGPETPQCYAPMSKNLTLLYSNFSCSPCVSAYNHRKTACTDNKCLQVIPAEYVYGLIKEKIS